MSGTVASLESLNFSPSPASKGGGLGIRNTVEHLAQQIAERLCIRAYVDNTIVALGVLLQHTVANTTETIGARVKH